MMGLEGPVAVAAHDAGAANILLAWIAADGLADVRPAMAGPAASLWMTRFPDARLMALEEALAGSRTLLSGTGWASSFEHDARKAARARGIRSVAVIDHWINYRMRFKRGEEEVLPDAIWVTDAHALAAVDKAIPEVPASVQPNLYLAEQVAAAGPRPAHGDLLFVAEPARSDWGRGIPGEFQALYYLVAHRNAAGVPPQVRLRLRPHPSDPPGKYDAWLACHPESVLDRSADMAEALRGAAWVSGLQSFALLIAIASGRPAISALPPWAPPCVLPHNEVLQLRDLAPR